MKPIELIGHVDEQRRRHVELPPEVQPGPVKITVRPATEEDEARDWLAPIDRSRAEDWSDPREDVCTLEDGKAR
jgi:hypothetical protein